MGLPRSRVAERTGTGVGAFALVLVGFFRGAATENVTLELLIVTVRVVFLEAISAVLVFIVFLLATGVLLTAEIWRSRDRRAFLPAGPPIEAIVPVYRDHEVMDRSVESLVESEYEDLRVTIVAEPSDDRTLRAARRLADVHERVAVLENGFPGSKAGAINYAVARSDADYFAVFDADEWVAPEFVPKAMGELVTGSDVFQGRRVPRPTGPIESLAYCERVIFHASYKLVELTGFANCRSSSTAFTRDAFRRVGGYDDVLTEDLAFAHACYRNDLTVTQARQWTNTMEAPHTLSDLWGQRKRWRMGQIEVLHRTLREALEGRVDRRGLVSIGRMLSSLLGSLAALMIAGKVLLLLLLGVESAFVLPIAFLLVTVGAVAARDARDGRIEGLHWSATLAFATYPAFGILTLKAFLEYAFSWEGEWYRVTKTGT
ncbi:glycosyltransferase [Natrialbaceae archaeon GCM10025810]|uniref:glycosyltransferase n=1 Tax=Halovalidus salilacus TaxID=3075124 RepID=UPI00361CF0D8